MMHRTRRAPGTVAVDPTRCVGHGLCAELLPERIALDEWGYPVISVEPVSDGVRTAAEVAAAACPVRALQLMAVSQQTNSQRGEA